jgi:hypothetical protein
VNNQWSDPNPPFSMIDNMIDNMFEEMRHTAWTDPNPSIQIIEHEGYQVVRDDLLGYGSKIRFVDYLIRTMPEQEIVFGSCPATGYAQISLPVVASRYGKSVHLFMAKRDPENYTEYQKRGLELGAQYHWIKDGMLNVTNARAREYQQANPTNRVLLPIGLEHPSVLVSIMKVARRQIPFTPEHVWTVGSSGTLNRGLQLAWPYSEIHVVSVGHAMKEREIGRAIHHRSPYKFDRPVKSCDAPPFPSAPTYDAKVWRPMIEWYKTHDRPETVLIWNVAS